MATVQKRGKAWRVQVRRNGKSVSASFDTHAEAAAWGIKTEARLLDGTAPESIKRDPAQPNSITAADLLRRYAREVSPRKRGCRWEVLRLEMLCRRYSLFSRPAVSITGPDMADWREERLKFVSASTTNRELSLISAVFTKAIKEWRIGLTVNPVFLIEKPKKPRPRTQRVNAEDRAKLLSALGWDEASEPTTPAQWVGFAFAFAIATAMRKGEILSLQWREIDFDRRTAYLNLTKNGEAREVPLSSVAVALLRLIPQPKSEAPVIPVQSGYLDRLFREARKASGLMHVRFHDSRREAASTMARKFNVLELSAITGHKSLQMLKVYYAADASELAARLDA